jgi:hypothetical protein
MDMGSNLLIVAFGTRPEWVAAKFRLQRQIKKSFPEAKVFIKDESYLKEIGFYDEHKIFINENPRGYGLWLWKPTILLNAIKMFPEVQLILYLDMGCELQFNTFSKQRFQEYCRIALESGGLGFELQSFEKDWTSSHTLKRMGAISTLQNQVMGTVFIIANNNEGVNFLESWDRALKEDQYESLTGRPSSDSKTDEINHRHDQSVLSILWHRSNFATIPDETYWPSRFTDSKNYPILANRNRLFISTLNPKILLTLHRVLRKIYISVYSVLKMNHEDK